jgi:hypothetical protein
MLAALPSPSFPDVTYLFVIRPGETALHDHLEQAFLGVPGVKIIMERRGNDRRAAHQRPGHDRRRTERRQPRGTDHALGYTTVRFSRSSAGRGA